MSEHSKPAWPKTPDGTTDWETVFEDTQTGLIPIISGAQSRQALRQCTHVVIQQLFTRKGDAEDVAKFTAQLDDILSTISDAEELGATITSVMALLRRIKDERIEKARLYVAQKNARQRTQERRAQKEYKAKRTASLMSFLLRVSQPKIAIGLFAVLLALTGGTYFAVGLFETPPAQNGERDAAKVANPPGASADGQSPSSVQNAAPGDGTPSDGASGDGASGDGASGDGKGQASGNADAVASGGQQSGTKTTTTGAPTAPGGAKALPVRPTLPRIIVLRPFSWPPFNTSARQNTTYYATLIHPSKDSKATATICRRYPQVVDAVYQAFNAAAIAGAKIDEKTLAKIATLATKTINSEVGVPYVESTELIRYGDPRFRTSNRHTCRLIRRPIPPIPRPPAPAQNPAKTTAATPKG